MPSKLSFRSYLKAATSADTPWSNFNVFTNAFVYDNRNNGEKIKDQHPRDSPEREKKIIENKNKINFNKMMQSHKICIKCWNI